MSPEVEARVILFGGIALLVLVTALGMRWAAGYPPFGKRR